MLLRDIEEYCGKKAEVGASTCLNRCGKGPNIQITSDGESFIVEGIKSFKRMEKMIADNVEDGELDGTKRKVAKLRYEARREETAEGKLAKISEAFDALGGEEKAIQQKPKGAAYLLTLRTNALLKSEADKALADGRAAVKLWPASPQPHLALSDVLAQSRCFADALEAMKQAVELTHSPFEKKELKKRLAVLEKKAAGPAGGAAKAPSAKARQKRRAQKKKTTEGEATAAPEAATAPEAAEPEKAPEAPQAEDVQLRMWGEDGLKDTTPLTEEEQAKTLYSRLGGDEPLRKMVYGVYDLMRADVKLGGFFERFARTPETFTRLKVRTVDYFGGEWGGPPYEGPNLFESHASMAIDDELYDLMMRCYAEMLKRIEAGPQETQEILEKIESMRTPVVDPGGLLVQEMEKRLAKASAARAAKMKAFKEQKAREEAERQAKEQKAREQKSKAKAPEKGKQAKQAKPDATKEEGAPAAEEPSVTKPKAPAESAEAPENPPAEEHAESVAGAAAAPCGEQEESAGAVGAGAAEAPGPGSAEAPADAPGGQSPAKGVDPSQSSLEDSSGSRKASISPSQALTRCVVHL